MRLRLAFASLICGYVVLACGGGKIGESAPGDGGAGNDATTNGSGDGPSGTFFDASNRDDSGDATRNGGGDDDGDGDDKGDDDGGGDTDGGNESGDDDGGNTDGGRNAADADAGDARVADAADGSDAGSVHDAGDAGDAANAADAGDADAGTFLTPTCDGTISTGEYGPGTEGRDQYSVVNSGTSTTVWHATWNDTALYMAIESADVTEGVVLYLDVNGGTAPTGGTNVGFNNYDDTDPSSLPFAADSVSYLRMEGSANGTKYHEYRTADLANGWSGLNTTQLQICPNSNGTTREIVIPWAVSGASRPTAFAFLGYVTSPAGHIYGQVPQSNPNGDLPAGTGAFGHDFKVTNSNVGQSTAFSNPQ